MAVGARDKARGEAAVTMLYAAGVDAFEVPLDVTSDRSVPEARELIERQGGGLDVLVNNAGFSGETGPGWVQDPTMLDLDLVRNVVETNVYGVIRVTNAMLPLLRRSASPRIVNISSSVGSAYSVSSRTQTSHSLQALSAACHRIPVRAFMIKVDRTMPAAD